MSVFIFDRLAAARIRPDPVQAILHRDGFRGMLPMFKTFSFATASAAMLLLGACGSAEQRAATAAGAAQQALAAGRPQAARALIRRALAERDDVSDYWLLLAQINIADKDPMGAFGAYENVLSFDRANVEALTRLCQIALLAGSPERAEKYAEQLAQLSADSTLADTVRAAVASARGRKDEARRLLDGILQTHPDDFNALVLQGRMREADGDFTGAAQSVERAITTTGADPVELLEMLQRYYKGARDREGYERTVARMARAQPNDGASQLALADILYERGERLPALRVVQGAMARRPDDVEMAAGIVNLWLAAGADAVPDDALRAGAAAASIEMKAAYAQYAAETGRAALAISILEGVAAGPGSPADAEARATLAYARGLRGDGAGQNAWLDAIIAADPYQPRARYARGRLRALGGNRAGAIEDLRQAVADDANNVAARIALADLLVQDDDAILAVSTLRQGLDASGDARLASRLARLMIAQGRRADATAMLADYARDNPLSLRAKRLVADGPGRDRAG